MRKVLDQHTSINSVKATLLSQKNIITSTTMEGVDRKSQGNEISNIPKGSQTAITNILVEILKYHILILVALIYIYLLNTSVFPHLSQIYFNYFQVLGQLLKAGNKSFTQEIISISIALYSLAVSYFVGIYYGKKYIFSGFLFLFVLWSTLTLGFKYPLSLVRVFVWNVVNLIRIDRIEAQELTTDIAISLFYTFFSFYVFKVLINKARCFLNRGSDTDGSSKADMEETTFHYGEIHSALQNQGSLIDIKGLVIASDAVEEEAALMTDNASEFKNVKKTEK